MFTAVLILILLTELIIFAVQVGVFEQRKSSNEARYKEAFHVAESGLQHAMEYFLANSIFIASQEIDLLSDGTDGWLAALDNPWRPCASAAVDIGPGQSGEHPCYGESGLDIDDGSLLRDDIFYFVNDPDVAAAAEQDQHWQLPINDDLKAIIANSSQDVSVYALLCVLDVDREQDTPIRGCISDLAAENFDERFFLVTLMARGQADCETNGDGDPVNCKAQALITEKVGSYGPGAGDGGPAVPLTTRSNFPPGGTGEIVTSPNASGVGVAVSAWLNGNSECTGQAIVDPAGSSWATCERHEWYETDAFPEDMACPTAQCSCGADERRLSYRDGGEENLNFDLVVDPGFPCDLFYSTFGVSGDATDEDPPPWQLIKDQATVIDDCSILDEDSFGLYWATGSECKIASNTRIGTAKKPVFLVSAASTTSLVGGAELFGVLFVTDVEDPAAELASSGTNTIYGAAIVDGSLDKYTGTFQIVYIDSVVGLATETGRFGAVTGGWSDFPADWR
jgi:hypothetical protein